MRTALLALCLGLFLTLAITLPAQADSFDVYYQCLDAVPTDSDDVFIEQSDKCWDALLATVTPAQKTCLERCEDAAVPMFNRCAHMPPTDAERCLHDAMTRTLQCVENCR